MSDDIKIVKTLSSYRVSGSDEVTHCTKSNNSKG